MTLLDARPGTDLRAARRGQIVGDHRVAIIDIGSNSVRLVVYDGPPRLPFVLFNEKVMAGLGASLARTGRIEPEAMERGLAALRRFHHLCRDMNVADVRCVATAAVREAANGPEFMERARELGLNVELLAGEREGLMSGYGVLSAIPDADGIVGDLGGGSLELVRVKDGEVHDALSLPLGVLRLAAIRARGKGALAAEFDRLLAAAGWADRPALQQLPFYMVGGSWRALGRLHMYFNDFPLPVIHHYELPPRAPDQLLDALGKIDKAELKTVPSLTSSRVPTLPHAAALLGVVARRLGSCRLVVSAYGLREGLLYADLPVDVRAQDPLLAAAEAEGEGQGRFPGHGDLIEKWIATIFPDDPPHWRRIRRAACLLADVGWRANPEFRAERGVEVALHGNWVGIDVEGRAMLAQTLHSNFGGGMTVPPLATGLASAEALRRAALWGLAIRLAQRLSGGVAEPLQLGRLAAADGRLALCLPQRHAGLYGESVEKRLKQLAEAIGLGFEFMTGD